MLLRAAEAAPGGTTGLATNLFYDASLLRTAAQKLVRRQMGVAAATVVLQYLRQLASPGAKNVNGERKKILERIVIAAAEDAGLANSLAIGVFHFLGATSPAIGFGARDAYAVAKGYGALASAPRPDERYFKELPDEPDESPFHDHHPERWAMSLGLRLMANNVRGNPERRWLRELEGSCRIQGPLPPANDWSPHALKPTEPLPSGCRPYFAVDFHNAARGVQLFADLRKAVPLAASRSDEALKKVLEPHAYLNMRDTELGICHKFNHKKPLPSHAEGSWEAQVLAAWDTVAARFWEPTQATGATQRKRPASDEGSSSQQKKLAFAP